MTNKVRNALTQIRWLNENDTMTIHHTEEIQDFLNDFESWVNNGSDEGELDDILWEYGFYGREENYVEVADED